MEIFWKTIGIYNSSTWIYQALIILVGAVLTVLLYRRPTKAVKKAMKLFMFFLNLWIAVVYYMIYCSERKFYYIFALFWGLIACMWLYDLFKGNYDFNRSYKYDKISYILYVLPFIYPLISLWRGLHFPEMTSPVMPCTVTIFTIGILMSFLKKINLFLVLFLFHWALLSISKIYMYGIPEDILLTLCTIPVLFLYFKESLNSLSIVDSKPGIRSINLLLLSTCCVIGVVFTYIIFKSFGYI